MELIEKKQDSEKKELIGGSNEFRKQLEKPKASFKSDDLKL